MDTNAVKEPASERSQGAARRHGFALGIYLLFSVALTWPMSALFFTHVPGDGIDDPSLAWNLWWVKASLVDHLQPDIFHVGWMFHPISINLAFYTLTPLNGLLGVPIQTGASLIVANNLLLLSSFVLSAYGAFLLVRTVWVGPLAKLEGRHGWAVCLVAGAFVTFSSVKLYYAALGQFNIASSQWIPFVILYLWRTLHSSTGRGAVRNGAMAGLFLIFQTWAELTYASFLFILALLLYIWWTGSDALSRSAGRFARWEQGTRGLLVAALLFGLGLVPFLGAMFPDLRAEGDFFGTGGGFADTFSADLMGYLVPTRLHPWAGAWTATLPFPNDKGQHIFLGFSLMGLAVAGAISGLRHPAAGVRRITAFWLVSALIFGLLTLGPHFRWAGRDIPVVGPFALISRLPFFSGNRYPSRYSVILIPAVTLLAAQALIRLTSMAPRPRAATILPGLLLLIYFGEHLSIPIPMNDYRVPPIYTRIAAEPGDFSILELPTGWRNGARVLGRSDKLIMMQQWYQSSHGKRRLGGNTSRNPDYKFQYYTGAPVLGDLIALMNADRDHLAPVLSEQYASLAARLRQDAPAVLDFLHVRFIVLHEDRSPELLVRAVQETLPVTLVEEWQGSDWEGTPAHILLYAVAELPDAPSSFSIGQASATHLLAEGWSVVADPVFGRAATRRTPSILLDMPNSGGQVVLSYAEDTTIYYRLNGAELGVRSGSRHLLDVPRGTAFEPVDRLALRITGEAVTASDLALAPSLIGRTGVTLEPGVTLVVQSAGEEVGDFAHIVVNGLDVAPNSRGYNLAALTSSGEVLEVVVFDTFTPGESVRMAAWINDWDSGTVIAGAVADEASYSLEDDAVAALQGLGVSGDLRGKFRHSHAFVGAAGVAPGTALEDESLIRPARVWLGAPVDSAETFARLLTLETVPAP